MKLTTAPQGTRYGKPGDLWKAGHHTGVDFLAYKEKLYAPTPGRVVHVGYGGWGAAYGKQVIVETTLAGRTVRWQAAHMSSTAVKVGQSVRAGAYIGRSGNTGTNTTGWHVHFEVRTAPFEYGDDVDPAFVLTWAPATQPKPGLYKTRLKRTPRYGRLNWPTPGPVRDPKGKLLRIVQVKRDKKGRWRGRPARGWWRLMDHLDPA